MIIVILALSLLGFTTITYAHVHEWAQLSQYQQDWFRRQTSPLTGENCCNEFDGEEVEEDLIKKGELIHYRVRSPKTHWQWVDVDPAVVIKKPNLYGKPVAWYKYINAVPVVRCFSPGPLI